LGLNFVILINSYVYLQKFFADLIIVLNV